VKFHLKIAEGARCELLRSAIEREQDLMYNWLSDRVAQIRPLPAGYHGKLAEAVASDDILRADEAAREHIRYAMAQLIDVIELPPSERWRRKRSVS
jgi:DNA-binding GntR family transcriptional regulator